MKRFVLGLALLAAGHAWAGAEWVRATVTKVDAPRSRVTLKHERIKSIRMAAMTMPFKVKDGAALQGLKAGDKVRFTVALIDDEPVVTAIEAAK
ncbi:MAG: copper-binding protein [Burkholderiales bacterium]|nr:copper-binding protein [Burkholderiales bacterium]